MGESFGSKVYETSRRRRVIAGPAVELLAKHHAPSIVSRADDLDNQQIADVL